jgi:hypothetical protein
MKFEELTAHFKDGTSVVGQVAVPETLAELCKLYPEERIYKLGLTEYLAKARKRLISKRSQLLRLRVNDLSTDQQVALRRLGLLK